MLQNDLFFYRFPDCQFFQMLLAFFMGAWCIGFGHESNRMIINVSCLILTDSSKVLQTIDIGNKKLVIIVLTSAAKTRLKLHSVFLKNSK